MPDGLGIQSFGRQEHKSEIRRSRRIDILLANIFGAALQLRFEAFDRLINCRHIAFLLRCNETVVIFCRKFRVDWQPDWRAVFIAW